MNKIKVAVWLTDDSNVMEKFNSKLSDKEILDKLNKKYGKDLEDWKVISPFDE